MATTNSDGSIILTTKVEDAGLKKGMEKIISEQKAKLQSLTREYAKLITNNQQNTEEAKKLKKEIDNLSKSIKQNENILKSFGKSSSEALEQTSEAVENSSKSFSKFHSALKSIAGYLALAFSVTKIIQFSKEAGQLATQAEASVQRLVDIYGSASTAVGDFIDQNARALGMSKSAAASFSSVYGNLFSVWADQSTNAELTNRYLQMTAVVASKTGRTVEDVQERIRSGLLGNTESIEDLGIFVNVKTIEMTDAFKRMANGRSWEQLDAYTQQQIRSMAILEQATAKYGDEVADTSATIRNKFNAAYQDFQNSWGEIVNRVLLPVLEVLTSIFDVFIKGLDALTGKSSNITDKIQEGTGNVSDNIEESNKNQEDFNDALEETEKTTQKILAGFDDLFILTSKGAEKGMVDFENKLDIPDDWGQLGTNNAIQETNDALAMLMSTVGTGLTAVGVVLLFCGIIGWGIGFVIAGAALYGVSEGALGGRDEISAAAEALMVLKNVVTGALIAVGVIMLFVGAKKLGAKLVGAGAVIFVEEVISAFNAGGIIQVVKSIYETVLGALLAVGVLMLFITGPNKTSVGLIATAAIGIITEILSLGNFDIKAISAAIEGLVHDMAKIMVAVGLMLLFTTGANAKSLSILFGGAALFLGTDSYNENISNDGFQSFEEKLNEILAITATAQIFVGLLLIFLGDIPHGVAFLISAAPSVGSARKGVQSFLDDFKDSVEDVGRSFSDLFDMGDTFQANWEYRFGKRASISIPHLAQGTVIPKNREFLAVLGDNTQEHEIVSPLSTMKQAFKEAITEIGGNIGGGSMEVVLELDGRELGRAIVEQGERESQRIGTRLVVI